MPHAISPRLSHLLRAYHLGPDHPMKIRLWTIFRRATGYRRLTFPYAGSGWITVDERDYVQQQIYEFGAYQPEVWAAIAAVLRPGDVLWDVGAHIGAVSIHAALDSRVRTFHAFEPDPRQLAALRLNLALNEARGRIHPVALSDRRETRQLHLGPSANSGLSGLGARPGAATIAIECRTADELVFDEGVDPPNLVKLDIEGWEPQVLRGMSRLLVERPPRAIVFEGAHDGAGQLANPELAALLATNGYTLRVIPRSGPIAEEYENYVATHA